MISRKSEVKSKMKGRSARMYGENVTERKSTYSDVLQLPSGITVRLVRPIAVIYSVERKANDQSRRGFCRIGPVKSGGESLPGQSPAHTKKKHISLHNSNTHKPFQTES
jgi:hypothetical protein